VTKSARRKENDTKAHRDFFSKGKEFEKKKFINLTDKIESLVNGHPNSQEDKQHASELRNDTEVFRPNNSWRR
jgi:hypothetical protein